MQPLKWFVVFVVFFFFSCECSFHKAGVEERLKNNVFVFLAVVDNNSAFLYLFALRFAGNMSVK